MKKNTKKVKKKIRFKRVFLALLIIFLVAYLINVYLKLPINNIIIKGNIYLTDQEIIDIANLSNYPSILDNSSRKIQNKLEKNIYIKNAKVKKNIHREVEITIVENKPLFYDISKGKTILENKEEISEMLDVPILVNYIPDTIYNEFIKNIAKVNYDILKRISEIKYDPSTVDEERILLLMNDQNKVYITLEKFNKINNYNDIMNKVLAKYENKNGTLYLDEGEYFVVDE